MGARRDLFARRYVVETIATDASGGNAMVKNPAQMARCHLAASVADPDCLRGADQRTLSWVGKGS